MEKSVEGFSLKVEFYYLVDGKIVMTESGYDLAELICVKERYINERYYSMYYTIDVYYLNKYEDLLLKEKIIVKEGKIFEYEFLPAVNNNRYCMDSKYRLVGGCPTMRGMD